MAAAITYLKEWGWQASTLMRWTRPETPFLQANELSLQQPWWKLERALLHEAKQQRISRLASRTHHQHLLTGIDWHTYHQVKKTLTQQHKHHLNTWVQAAVQLPRSHPGQAVPPVPALQLHPKHILWLCKWHKQQKHEPMPPEWMNRITSHEEEPLWTAGWIPLEPQEHRRQDSPIPGPWLLGWLGTYCTPNSITAGLTHSMLHLPPMTTRDQMWVYGLCVHTMTLGQLQRLGAITGVASGEQTKTRALLAGVVASGQVHHHTCPCHCPAHNSLGSLAPTEKPSTIPGHSTRRSPTRTMARITVLYISREHENPRGSWQ